MCIFKSIFCRKKLFTSVYFEKNQFMESHNLSPYIISNKTLIYIDPEIISRYFNNPDSLSSKEKKIIKKIPNDELYKVIIWFSSDYFSESD